MPDREIPDINENIFLLYYYHGRLQNLTQAYKTYRPHTSLKIPEARLLSKDYPLTDSGLDSLIEES